MTGVCRGHAVSGVQSPGAEAEAVDDMLCLIHMKYINRFAQQTIKCLSPEPEVPAVLCC
jgi:hypothetical protein